MKRQEFKQVIDVDLVAPFIVISAVLQEMMESELDFIRATVQAPETELAARTVARSCETLRIFALVVFISGFLS